MDKLDTLLSAAFRTAAAVLKITGWTIAVQVGAAAVLTLTIPAAAWPGLGVYMDLAFIFFTAAWSGLLLPVFVGIIVLALTGVASLFTTERRVNVTVALYAAGVAVFFNCTLTYIALISIHRPDIWLRELGRAPY